MDKAFPAKGSTSTGKQEKTFLCKYLEGVNRLLLSILSNELLVPAGTCMYSNNFKGVLTNDTDNGNGQ